MANKEVNISIIVPIYNVSEYLDKCLSSIAHQIYGNFEVLLIDDGSTDNSKEICSHYVKKDSRFKYIRKQNGGLSDARNCGLDNAIGNYVIFIDSDDYIKEQYVGDLYKAIKKHNADVAICGFNRVSKDNQLIDNNNLSMVKSNVTSGINIIKHSFDENGWALACAWNKIYKKSLFSDLKFDKGKYYEDGFIFPSLFLKIKKAAIIHKALYLYVQRNNSIVHSAMNIKKIKDGNSSLINEITIFEKKNLNDLYMLAIQTYIDWILSLWVNNRRLIKEYKMGKYFRSQYHKYIKVKILNHKKINPKEIIGYVSFNLYYLLRKYLRIS